MGYTLSYTPFRLFVVNVGEKTGVPRRYRHILFFRWTRSRGKESLLVRFTARCAHDMIIIVMMDDIVMWATTILSRKQIMDTIPFARCYAIIYRAYSL